MGRCYEVPPNTTTALNDTRKAVLNAPGCALESYIRNSFMSTVECFEVQCLPSYQEVFIYTCLGAAQQYEIAAMASRTVSGAMTRFCAVVVSDIPTRR